VKKSSYGETVLTKRDNELLVLQSVAYADLILSYVVGCLVSFTAEEY